MTKTKIPGSAYLIIGAGIVLMSFFINYEKLAFFIVCGAVFILIGFVKVVLKLRQSVFQQDSYSSKRKNNTRTINNNQAQHPAKSHTHVPTHHQSHTQQHSHPQHNSQQHNRSHTQQQSQINHTNQSNNVNNHPRNIRTRLRCSNCGSILTHEFKFCSNCGQKLY